jgi:hypothetical protein
MAKEAILIFSPTAMQILAGEGGPRRGKTIEAILPPMGWNRPKTPGQDGWLFKDLGGAGEGKKVCAELRGGKTSGLLFLGAFDDEAGYILFPFDVTVINQGDEPNRRGPHHKSHDNRGSPSIHLCLTSWPR